MTGDSPGIRADGEPHGSRYGARERFALSVVDDHAPRLLQLAQVVSGSSTTAVSVVTRLIVTVSLDHARLVTAPRLRAELSRRAVWACADTQVVTWDTHPEAAALREQSPPGPAWSDAVHSLPFRERALLALTVFGDHTYEEAAGALGLRPDTAAELLRESLHVVRNGLRMPPSTASPAGGSTLEPTPETVVAMAEYLGPDEPEIEEVLAELGERASRVVPEIVGLSLGLLREGVTFTLVASGDRVAAIDAAQYLDGGPCVEVTEGRRDVVEFTPGDPLDEDRWLLFARATAAAGVASSLSLPIVVADHVIGGINLYASTAQAFTGRHEELAGVLGASATAAVTNADLSFATRLEAARAPALLRTQSDIETAVGLLAAWFDRDDDLAGARLLDAATRADADAALVARMLIVILSRQGEPW